MVGMALGTAGEVCRRDCKLQNDLSNHGELRGQMDGKQQGAAGSPEPPDPVGGWIAHNGQSHPVQKQ
jgi:hypothetical protein